MYGARAIFVSIYSNIINGNNTITGIISRWAPPNENDTVSYINDVSSKTGIDANAALSNGFYLNPGAGIMNMVNAIINHEGNAGWISQADIQAGYNQFINDFNPS